jgi:hypothetical protein
MRRVASAPRRRYFEAHKRKSNNSSFLAEVDYTDRIEPQPQLALDKHVRDSVDANAQRCPPQ